MSADLEAVALGGFFTLAGGGCVAFLSSWLSNKAYDNQRDERRRTEQRDYVIEVVDAGKGWVTGLSAVGLAMGSIPDPVELTNTDTWIQHQPKVERYRRALNAADLMLRDPNLHRRAQLLESHMAMQSDVTEPISSTAHATGHATLEQLQALWAYCDKHKSELDAFVKAARSHLL